MRQLEIERKFDIPEGAPLPGLGDVVQTGAAREHRMRAVYLDTVDLLLIRHRITLRRREGGSDEGWHLKLPRGSARLEVHAPLGEGPGRTRVPDGHVKAVSEALAEGLPSGPAGALVPVAVLRTVRVEVDLLDDDGRLVAQLCDDVVTALPQGITWRELEVELVGAAEGQEAMGTTAGGEAADDSVQLLDSIAAALQAQGLTPSASPSKLSRALGDRPERMQAGQRLGAKDRAGDVVQDYLVEQLLVILGREGDLRVDALDAVHKSRVAVRRTRSAVRTFRRLLHREGTAPVRV